MFALQNRYYKRSIIKQYGLSVQAIRKVRLLNYSSLFAEVLNQFLTSIFFCRQGGSVFFISVYSISSVK